MSGVYARRIVALVSYVPRFLWYRTIMQFPRNSVRQAYAFAPFSQIYLPVSIRIFISDPLPTVRPFAHVSPETLFERSKSGGHSGTPSAVLPLVRSSRLALSGRFRLFCPARVVSHRVLCMSSRYMCKASCLLNIPYQRLPP
jgi:hypothetical protein